MVNDAERYKNEDEKQKNRIAAKNALESYCFHMKSTVEDDKLKDKISADDKKTILDKCAEVKLHLLLLHLAAFLLSSYVNTPCATLYNLATRVTWHFSVAYLPLSVVQSVYTCSHRIHLHVFCLFCIRFLLV